MSFPAYPDYKHSGVELLPEYPGHWTLKRFKNVFAERAERSSDGSEELLSVSAYFGVKPRSETLDEGDHLSRAESLEGYKVCRAGDLVINIMLAWNRGLGFSWQHGIVSPAYSVFHVTDGSLPKFLDYLVRSDECIRYFKTHSAGIMDSRLRLYPESFGRLFGAIPPACEQTQIARFLDHETARIDALIEEQQRLIELLKEKRQAVISHAVTKGLDPTVPMKDSSVEWLGEVPAHWDVSRLKYHSSRIGDGLHSTPEYDDAGDYFFINGNNLVGGSICITATTRQVNFQEFLKHRVLLNSSTVLISINGTIGNLALYSGEPVILGKSAAYINCAKSLSPRFCLYLFSSGQIKRFFESQLTGTTIYNLSLRTIAETPTPLPSIDEQNCIVEFLNRQVGELDELIDNAIRLSQLLQERRSALISAAVTGKIDVRGWQPTANSQHPSPESAVAEAV
ncbi:restriction endonuclease subunit S [Stutzerimonas nitrititolerans]|uniref:restriction endonuclease subunit S n=1 Tax=Stutzerimonas nitrititolerans TaxID=2482751 RepID=UPI00289BB159|nr:restriction endonuclease subunit S [Stutzerimonas nitrititolerans]